jgi:hypothetical protein
MQGSYFDSIGRAWLNQRPGGNLKLPEAEKLLALSYWLSARQNPRLTLGRAESGARGNLKLPERLPLFGGKTQQAQERRMARRLPAVWFIPSVST